MDLFNWLRSFNEKIATWGVKNFGTMFCFWICFFYGFLAIIPVLAPYQNTLLYWSSWVQLWALPLLMVGNIILSRDAEKRANQDHETLMAEFQEIKEVHAELHALLDQIRKQTKD